MFYRDTEVVCHAIMYEERKGGSKEGSSKGNKKRQIGLCLPVALLNKGGGLLPLHPQHTHTDNTLSFPSHQSQIVCLCVSVACHRHARIWGQISDLAPVNWSQIVQLKTKAVFPIEKNSG